MKKYYLKIFGCQMNKSDAERISSLLDSLNYQETESIESADLVVLVTCSVRQSAEDRVYGLMRQVKKLKVKSRKLKIVLTGCLALQKHVIKKLPDVDVFLDIKDLNKLPELLNLKTLPAEVETYFSIKPKYKSSFTAYVPIMTGCNNFCTYCVVPYVRGREESRDPQEIIAEVKDLLDQGYKEIILLGQNVNSYQPRTNSYQPLSIRDFADLLEAIAKLDGDFWIRFVTSHPKDLSDKLINVIAENNKVTQYIHLPVQAGDDTVLKKMNRKYTVTHYKNLIKKIRKAIPGVAISTDIIVGFPGETEDQFNNTAQTMQEISYDMAYIAQYSPRPQTSAAKLKDDVTKQEKKHREVVLTDILKKSALENNKKLLNKEVEVLVEKEKNNYWIGKTRGFKVVKFKSNLSLLGQFVKVKISKVDNFGLQGKI